jgi:hypothetical protein
MKTKILKLSIVLSILLIGFTSCSKDEFSTDGKLSVSFVNHPSDLTVLIVTIEKPEIPIYEITPNKDGKLNLTINVGEYVLIPYSSGTFFGKTGFQIIQDKTTTITFDKGNKATRS